MYSIGGGGGGYPILVHAHFTIFLRPEEFEIKVKILGKCPTDHALHLLDVRSKLLGNGSLRNSANNWINEHKITLNLMRGVVDLDILLDNFTLPTR